MDVDVSAQLTAARDGDLAVVRACGDLDFATTTVLLDALERAVGAGVVCCALDCERVTFIDSEVIKTLLALRSSLSGAGVRFELRNPSRQVKRVLDLLGLDSRLQSH